MKVLLFIGSLKFGGAERVVTRLANALIDRGVDVTVVLIENKIAYKLHPNVKVKILGKRGWNAISSGILLYFKLCFLLFREKPNVAVAFSRFSSILLGATFYRKVIGRFDIYPLLLSKRKFRSALFVFNSPLVKKVICPSVEMLNDVSSYFNKKQKLLYLPNPIKREDLDTNITNEFDKRFENGDKYIISVGRLATLKNVELGIKAYAKSNIRFTHKFIIVGEGPTLKKLKTLVDESDYRHMVTFTGFLENPFYLIENARYLIATSFWEGLPNTQIESLALGTPVISTKCPSGPGELIEHGKNGYLLPVNDLEALIKIFDNINDIEEESYQKMRISAVQSVSNLDTEIIVDKWEVLLRDI